MFPASYLRVSCKAGIPTEDLGALGRPVLVVAGGRQALSRLSMVCVHTWQCSQGTFILT